jgi:eukaryotic-like serine/threonine-protein kinase
MIGECVSHYMILEEIGKGGMGLVYKARDTHLDRLVAIKILPPEKISDLEHKRRLLQEAKAASVLNHPHIITIYDVDVTDGVAFIAMEYIKGKTLSQLIPKTGLPPKEAIKYAIQIADALAALHARGIIHRDLKPTNVMVAEGSIVKVLDFGLAKLMELIIGENETIQPSMERTSSGMIMGTPTYMSPEQLEGKSVDTRTDIFSFGVLLYEMLAGHRPFQGNTGFAVTTAIMNNEPVPLTQVNRNMPPEIDRTVSHCLEKDPRQRFQNAADLKFSLEWLVQDIESGKLQAFKQSTEASGRIHHKVFALALLPVILVTAGALVYWTRPAPQSLPDPVSLTFDSGLTTNPTLSPDGKLLAYASDRSGEGNLDIWLQWIAGGQPVRRTHDPIDETDPDFSPDGSSIVFRRMGSGIFIIPTLAGEERQIAPSGLFPRFSPDGMQILYWAGDEDNPAPSGKIFITPLGRSAPIQIAANFADARYPLWASDGKHILFQGRRSPGDETEWWVVSTATGSAVNTGILTELRKRKLSPIPGPGDWMGDVLAFSAFSGAAQENQHIWQTILHAPDFRFSGSFKQITFGTGLECEPSIASDGKIALTSLHHRINLWRLPLQKGESHQRSLERLSETGTIDLNPSISSDAKKVAFLSRRSGISEVWIHELESNKENKLTIGPGDKSAPVIAPDGSLVAYSAIENGKPSIYIVPIDSSRSGGARRVCENCGTPSDWTPDGKEILYTAGFPQWVYRLNLESGASVPILQHPAYNLDQPHVSPDNRWIAFVAAISPDRSRLFISPMENTTPAKPNKWIGITDGSSWDDKPRWLGNDALIYYSNRDHFGCVWKQHLNSTTMQPMGSPSAVCHLHQLRCSPRTLYRKDFEITTARNLLILNLVEITGNIWSTPLSSSP